MIIFASRYVRSYAGASPGTLQVVHRTCSPAGNRQSPSDHTSLLHRDHLRVQSIHHRRLSTSNGATTLPARLGLPFGSLEYVVMIGIGTPTRNLTVIFDTGSDLTWVQCLPCMSCYSQEEPIFRPRLSSTYDVVRCAEDGCSMSGGLANCQDSSCVYRVDYGDGSSSNGYLARETLTLSPASRDDTDTLTRVLFGCGAISNDGFSDRAAGLLGLGQGASSIVAQTRGKYKGVFSYCLPPHGSSTGYLAFGAAPSQPNIQFTPMVSNPLDQPSYYFVELNGIAVNGRTLPISPSVFAVGTIIDSGTVITRLPPAAYAALRTEFRIQMSDRYPVARAMGRFLDTCYDLTGYDDVVVPRVALLFSGGARIDVDASGVLLVADVSQACLAFAPNEDAGSIGIIGNMQQRAYSMVFDMAGGRVGFGADGCS